MASLKCKSALLERQLDYGELPLFPADGSFARCNPPPFGWLTFPDVAFWQIHLTDERGKKLTFKTKEPAFVANHVLPAGFYQWFYVGLDASGHEIGRSKIRTVNIPPEAIPAPIPDTATLVKLVRDKQPRILGKRIATIKRKRDKLTVELRNLATWCRLAEKEPLIPEPSGYRPFGEDTEEYNEDWIRIYSAGKVGSAHAARFALSFLLTGNKKHLTLAKKWALHLISWNPFGTTSAFYTDEASMPILERLSWVYDWLRPYWSDYERDLYLTSMQARGQEVLLKYQRIGFAARPFDNHMCRQLGFLGAAALAFLGEIPEADEWGRYVLTILASRYPGAGWGSIEGGWANGLNYWAAYMQFLHVFLAATAELGINLKSAEFYKNTGYFPIYHLPPYAERGGFGDGACSAPGISHKIATTAFAALAENQDQMSYASAINATLADPLKQHEDKNNKNLSTRWDAFLLSDVVALLLPLEENRIKTTGDYAKLPQSRLFDGIGWASVHTALGNAEKDVWLEFKSSRFGSFSHSHADQNSFNLQAFGKPLLIDSGYYPWYGSPHDTLWSRQTWAHNAILINGHGQPPFDWDAKGKIESFGNEQSLTYVRGEAAAAYNRPASDEALKLAETHAPDLVKLMGPSVKVIRASRSIALIRDTYDFIVVLDWLETEKPAKFQWIAHAINRFEINENMAEFTTFNTPAKLTARFITPNNLKMTMNNQFAGVKPEGRFAKSPNQWHLTAETVKASKTCRFMTVLIPSLKGNAVPKIKLVNFPGAIGFILGECTVIAPVQNIIDKFSGADGICTEAALLVQSGKEMWAAEAKEIKHGKRVLYKSESNTLLKPITNLSL